MIDADKLLDYMRLACTDILDRGTIDARAHFPLRLGQQQGLQASLTYFGRADLTDAEKLEGFYKMTVGLGKTGFYEAVIDRVLYHAQEDGINLRVGIVAPKIELLEQVQREFVKFFPHLKDQVGIYGGYWPKSHKPRRETDKAITAVTFPSWVTRVDKGEMNDTNTDILITDEGHRGISEARKKRLLENFVRAARYAFMATPDYDQQRTVRNTHKREIFSKGLVESVHDGESAAYIRAQHHVIRVAPPKRGKEADFDPVRAKQLAFIEFVKTLSVTGVDATGKIIGYDEVTGDRLTDNKMGVYTGDTSHADRCAAELNTLSELQKIAEEFNAKKFAVSVHTKGIEHGQQKKLKEAYEKGKRRTLCGDELFKEGYDHPAMKVVAIYQTGSALDLEQIIGRAVRQFWNTLKNRYEGATTISTTIYIGVDPLNPDDPAEVKRARLADEKERQKALAASASAVDILEGNAEVLGPSVKPTQNKPRPIASPRPFPPGMTVHSYTSVEDIRTIHTEREQARRELEQDEPRVDLAAGSYHKNFLDHLLLKKGHPGQTLIYNALPIEARQPDAAGRTLFTGDHIIENAIRLREGRNPSLTRAQFAVLLRTLRDMRDRKYEIDLQDGSRHRHFLDQLLEKRGNPSYWTIMPALPPETRIPDSSGQILFQTEGILRAILEKRQKSTDRNRFLVIMKTLRKLPVKKSKIDLSPDSRHRKLLMRIYEKKGRPGSRIIFNMFPTVDASAGTPEAAFGSYSAVDDLFTGHRNPVTGEKILKASLSRDQFLILLRTMRKMSGIQPRVDLGSKSPQRKLLNGLWAKKGCPGMSAIANAAPSATITNKRGEVMTKESIVSSFNNVLILGNKSLPKPLFEILISALETLPDDRVAKLPTKRPSQFSKRAAL